MGYENSAGLSVHNHYGPRVASGVRGVEPADGVERKLIVKIDPAVALDDQFVIPAGAIVTGVTGPVAVTAVSVGGTAVKAATEAEPVAVTTAGAPVITGGAKGDVVIIKYIHVAGTIKLT